MKVLFRVALTLVLAASARGEDAPAAPPRHVNKVSAEAKAAIERYQKITYRPAEHGLHSASGFLKHEGEMAQVLPSFEFRPPAHVSLIPTSGVTEVVPATFVLSMPLAAALEGFPLVAGDEYDADVADKDGTRALVVRRYLEGAVESTHEYTLDASGLMTELRMKPGKGASPVIGAYRFSWRRAGDHHCIATIHLSEARSSTARRMSWSLTYAQVAGFHVLRAFDVKAFEPDTGESSMSIRVDQLTLNGKPADLAPSHVNRVSREAAAAIEKFSNLAYQPARKGLVAVTGRLVPDELASPQPVRFIFKPPAHVTVTLTSELGPDSPQGRVVTALNRYPLALALVGVQISESAEFDADLIEKEGRRTLVVSEYEHGIRTATSESTLDSIGLVSSVRRKYVGDPAAPLSDVTHRFTWARSGGLYRIAAATMHAGTAEKPTSVTHALTYTTIEGLDLLTSQTMTISEPSGTTTIKTHVEDLVVNGKAIVLPKPGTIGATPKEE